MKFGTTIIIFWYFVSIHYGNTRAGNINNVYTKHSNAEKYDFGESYLKKIDVNNHMEILNRIKNKWDNVDFQSFMGEISTTSIIKEILFRRNETFPNLSTNCMMAIFKLMAPIFNLKNKTISNVITVLLQIPLGKSK